MVTKPLETDSTYQKFRFDNASSVFKLVSNNVYILYKEPYNLRIWNSTLNMTNSNWVKTT